MKFSKEELIDRIASISEIIWMELPLRYQDNWVESIMKEGIWQPDPEMVEGAKKETEE